MKSGIMTVWNYAALLILLMYFVNTDSKRKKSSFTFEALMSGMNGKEKEMFKEELNKEVKRFRAAQQQKHHKPKGLVVRKAAKKRKLKEKLPKFLPGICDPICAHECLHGCDFRCCIPDYQQNHKIPRPPPMVVLPGSCSSTCSPTCRPLCTDKCCAGGVGGMFQSSQDLVTLNSQTCPAGCSKACLPRCVVACCVAHVPEYKGPVQQVSAVDAAQQQRKETGTSPGFIYPVQQNPLLSPPNIAPVVEQNVAAHLVQRVETQPGQSIATQPGQSIATQPGQSIATPQPGQSIATLPGQSIVAQFAQSIADKTLSVQQRKTPVMLRRPLTPMAMAHTLKTPELYFYSANAKCTRLCPDYCAPHCLEDCCIAAKRDYSKLQPLIKPQNDPFPAFHRQPMKTPLELQYAAAAGLKPNIQLSSRHNCPLECFTSCKPNCEVRCCNLQPNILNQLNHASMHPALHVPDIQSDNFMKAAAYRLTQANLLRKTPLKVNSLFASRLLPHVLAQPVKEVEEPVTEHIESMDPNSVNFASNVETIHALSKDMISKPERSKQKLHVRKFPITEVSTPKGSIPKVASSKDSNSKDSNSKDSNSKDSVHKNSHHKESLHKDSVRADSLHKESLHKDSVHKDSVRVDSVRGDSLHKDSLNKDSVHGDSLNKDSVHGDSLNKDPVHGDSLNKNSVHGDSLNKDSVHGDSLNKDSVHGDSVHKGQQVNTTLPHTESQPVSPTPPSELIVKKSVLPSTLDISWSVDARNAVQPVVKKEEVYHPLTASVVNVAGSTKQVPKNTIALANIHYPHPLVNLPGKKSILKPQISPLMSGIPAPNQAPQSTKTGTQMTTADVNKAILEDQTLISDLASADIKPSVTSNLFAKKTTLPIPVIKESPLTNEALKRSQSQKEELNKSALLSVNKSASPLGEPKTTIIQKTKKKTETKISDIKKSVIQPTPKGKSNNKNNDKKSKSSSASTCPHQCPSECAPNCSKSCCNRQIVYESFHKNQKKSKIAFQLELLK